MEVPETLTYYLSMILPMSIIIVIFVLAQLSKRQGKITRRPPLYRWFYVSAGLMMAAFIYRLWVQINFGNMVGEAAAFYDLPVMVALLLAVVIAWQYWGWMLGDRGNRPEQ